jgi:hypothetical protein
MTQRQTSRTRGPAHRLLPSYSPGLLRDLCPPENPTKIGQKSVYFHKCGSFNSSAPIAYKFNLSKETDFPAPNPWQLSLFASLPLCVFALKAHQRLAKSDPFLRSAPMRVTGQNETCETETACATATLFGNTQTFLRPVSFCSVRHLWTSRLPPLPHVKTPARKSSKSANSPISADSNHAVPSTYAKSKSAYADFSDAHFPTFPLSHFPTFSPAGFPSP